MYLITDGNKYLYRNRKGKYELGAKSLADLYETKDKAENVLSSCLTKVLQAKCYVSIEKNNENSEQNLSMAEQEPDELIEWKEKITMFQSFADQVEKKMEELNHELSNIDQEICDINHYIEFEKLNAYQGWVACKMLQIRFRQRRKIKNKISVLQSLGNSKVSSSCLTNVLTKIGGLNDLTYEPRRLSSLFKGKHEVHYEL